MHDYGGKTEQAVSNNKIALRIVDELKDELIKRDR